MTIWKLVEQCAKDLTKKGLIPFTRSDLIEGVQKINSSYGPDSINPIIQGLTDNLKGGAIGANGKNILHSVGRGYFILNTNSKTSIETDQININQNQKNNPNPRKSFLIQDFHTNQIFSDKIKIISGYEFQFVCFVEPEREIDGKLRIFTPQENYANIQKLALNNYGKGPFCKFKIPNDIKSPGVYALEIANEIMYIGECISMSQRFNMGYGIISPRNCFTGGQETNCRINNLILEQILAGKLIILWFLNTADHKSIEAELRARLLLRWNRI